jgi:hypothetical protein
MKTQEGRMTKRKTVRWGTEFEDDDCATVVEAITDDVARALDAAGWMIVRTPDMPNNIVPNKWPMSSMTGHVPEWALDLDTFLDSTPPTLRLVPKPEE